MSETWFDLAPPGTWQRFEELCADTFEAVFRDPALVRYGRSGQAQSGIDILATDGAISPIGLQCKQKRRWPVRKLTTADIDAEVAKALKFTPLLKAFYILTTAPGDTRLDNHAAKLTQAHRAKGLFPVHVIGWQEICRRATLHPAVARKHFGLYGGDPPKPVLATWVTAGGRLIVGDEELALSVRELRHAWRAFPHGRLVVRQQESEHLMAKIKAIPLGGASMRQRRQRVDLQDQLERLERNEPWVETALRLLLTDRDLEYYPGSLHKERAATMVRSVVERRLDPGSSRGTSDYKLKLVSPRDRQEDVSSFLRREHFDEIWAKVQGRQAKFGHPATDTLGELPDGVLSTVAVPLVLDRLVHLMEEGATLEELRARGLLQIGSWKVQRLY